MRRSSRSPSAYTTTCTAIPAMEERWGRRRGASTSRPWPSRGGAGPPRAPRRRRLPARSADGRNGQAGSRARGVGRLALPRRGGQAERAGAGGLGLSAPRAERGRRAGLLARAIRLGGARRTADLDHAADHRRLLSEEPGDGCRNRRLGAGHDRAGPGRFPPPPIYHRNDGAPARVNRKATIVQEDRLPAEAPLVAQVSRWDRLKDPVGLLAVLRRACGGRGLALGHSGAGCRGRRRRPRGRRGSGRGARRARGDARRRSRARPPGQPADGRPRRERRDGQRATAPRRRRRPEEHRRGVWTHRRRGDVEAEAGGGRSGRRNPGSDRRR